MSKPGFVICREDGHFYLGMIDSKAVFGHDEAAAVFGDEAAAVVRAQGLERADPLGRLCTVEKENDSGSR